MATIPVPDSGYFEYAPLLVKRWLDDQLPEDVPVKTQIPNPRPERLVVVTSSPTSSQANIALSQRRCIIKCWDRTELLACRMAEKVRGFLVDATHSPGNGIRAVRVVGEPALWPDPDDPSKTPRAILTVDITVRAIFAL